MAVERPDLNLLMTCIIKCLKGLQKLTFFTVAKNKFKVFRNEVRFLGKIITNMNWEYI